MAWDTFTVIGLTLVVIFSPIVVYYAYMIMRSNAVRNWPTTEGTVLTAGIDRKYVYKAGYTFAPVVVYEYNVNGQTYRSDKMHYMRVYGSRKQSSIIDYTPNTKVLVYYNPYNPAQAVLIPGVPRRINFLVYFFGTWVIAGLVLLVI